MGLRCAGRGGGGGREVTVDGIGVVVTFRSRDRHVPHGIFLGLHRDDMANANAAAKEEWFRFVRNGFEISELVRGMC